VKPAPFTYHRPARIEDAVRLLAELAPVEGRVLAGGQSLVPIMAFRLARPAHLVDINAVAGLDRLEARGGALRIGALARHARFHRRVVDGPLGALLAAVVRHIAHYPIRLRGTFCGSLAHADPAAEWGVVTASLDGELVAVSARGERRLAARDFFQGAVETALLPDELRVGANGKPPLHSRFQKGHSGNPEGVAAIAPTARSGCRHCSKRSSTGGRRPRAAGSAGPPRGARRSSPPSSTNPSPAICAP